MVVLLESLRLDCDRFVKGPRAYRFLGVVGGDHSPARTCWWDPSQQTSYHRQVSEGCVIDVELNCLNVPGMWAEDRCSNAVRS